MKWKGQSKTEQEKQFTGFSCDAGSAGYLRASIGMVRENRILRALFPGYWDGRNDAPYNFEANFERMLQMSMPYFCNCISGEEFELTEQETAMTRVRDAILVALRNAGWTDESIRRPGSGRREPANELAFGITWFHSLIEFFQLGIEMQQKGKKPYPYISW